MPGRGLICLRFCCALQGEWNDVPDDEKDQLGDLIRKCTVTVTDQPLLEKINYFLKVYKDAWKSAVLSRILTCDKKLVPDQGKSTKMS